ncbi:hypothetical protein EVAR_26523_1 [Eumeta japonica]|uniref:Uncharacterized protein n=1 Tax=Eumeta variegata TaxID=151549 RepID=A0A4C1V957_EUMVA|nr:hypothetical protein EVAR_26523_1 [Eumeta japonica]
MSILHTLAPVRSVETSQMTSQTTLIASPSAAGRHMRVPTARDMRWTTPGGSRLGIGCRRKPSRVGSLLLPEAVSGPGGVGSLGR